MKERKNDQEHVLALAEVESNKLQGKGAFNSNCLNCKTQLIEKEKLIMLVEAMNSQLN
jgi:hypothetical protein